MHGDFQFLRPLKHTRGYPDIRRISEWIGHRRTTGGAEIGAEARWLNKRRNTFCSGKPAEIVSCDNGSGIRNGAPLLAAQGAMALIKLWDDSNNFKRNRFTETFAAHLALLQQH